MIIDCPACKKPSLYSPENEFRPFCSERCKLIDLGAWAEEKYRVAAENQSKEDVDAVDIDED